MSGGANIVEQYAGADVPARIELLIKYYPNFIRLVEGYEHLKNGKETVKQWQEHEVVHICTEEQKRQISLKNSGRKRTEEERKKQSERMKEYWKTHTFTEEQRKSLSEKKKEYWNDREASEAHRQKLSCMMKEMRAGNAGAGKEGDGNA